MVLTRAQIVLQTDPEKRLTSSIGSLLQGALMQHIDPAYGEVLHRSELKPYSQYISFGASGAIWTVQTLTEEAETQIVQPLLSGSFTSLRLEHKDLELPILSKTVTHLTEEELMQQTFFAECSRKVRLRFITPCSFKSQGVYQIFPSIRLMFQSLVNRYDAMSEKNSVFYPELLEDLEQHTMITEYRLQSRLFGVEGISIPSYQGYITLRMSGPQQMVNLMHMLLRFGTYSGIGIKTAMGMGGLQIEERKRTNENRTV